VRPFIAVPLKNTGSPALKVLCASPEKNVPFLSFSYVCPEEVLVK
jgi:hypothetical protein